MSLRTNNFTLLCCRSALIGSRIARCSAVRLAEKWAPADVEPGSLDRATRGMCGVHWRGVWDEFRNWLQLDLKARET
jgi:hypothetical protein